MTDEQLEKLFKEVSEEIDRLAQSKEPLTKEAKRHRRALFLKKAVLDNIRSARAKHHTQEELYSLSLYSLVCSWGEKHPFLMTLLFMKFRGIMF